MEKHQKKLGSVLTTSKQWILFDLMTKSVIFRLSCLGMSVKTSQKLPKIKRKFENSREKIQDLQQVRITS